MARRDLHRLLKTHHRRLQKLKENQAAHGVDTPPHVLTEIEDVAAEIEMLQTELQTTEDDGVIPTSVVKRVSIANQGIRDLKIYVYRLLGDVEKMLELLIELDERLDDADERQLRLVRLLYVIILILTAIVVRLLSVPL